MPRSKLNKKELQTRLMSFLSSRSGEYFSLKQVFSNLRLTTHPVKMLCVDIINEYLDSGKLIVDTEKRIAISKRASSHTQISGISAKAKAKANAKPDDNQVMHDILQEYGLPYGYPKAVADYAEQLNPEISRSELKRREDFRDVLTFTIDPHDAKDFDDAISFRIAPNSLLPVPELVEGATCSLLPIYEVGVHIADVSHYVKEGSPIDIEAEKRGTSIYLVDRTIPMLPERLCNFICSLRPDEEKLAYSVVFNMDAEANVLSYRIVHTVIKSNRRFTYEEVEEILDRGEGELHEELAILNSLSQQLCAKRIKQGAIEFNSEEMRFDVDETGHPVGVYFHTPTPATKLIEEFMLLANRTVAESVGKTNGSRVSRPKTLPYRIHDMPDPEKLGNLARFVQRFNYSLQTDGSKKQVARSLNHLLSDVKGDKIQKLVDNVALRAMMKAKYSTVNIGHYGLAFDYYTHFTSPIRRYPDLMVHRLLTRYAEGGASASRKKYEALCEHASSMEQLATAAERASVKYKMVEFLTDLIGQEFDATITGVTEFGIYSEIDTNHCEGFTNQRFLGESSRGSSGVRGSSSSRGSRGSRRSRGEFFDFDEKNFCLVGRESHHRFQIGDRIRIRVARTNLERKTVDFDFIKKL